MTQSSNTRDTAPEQLQLKDEMLAAWNEPNGVQACIEVAQLYADREHERRLSEAGKGACRYVASVTYTQQRDGKINTALRVMICNANSKEEALGIILRELDAEFKEWNLTCKVVMEIEEPSLPIIASLKAQVESLQINITTIKAERNAIEMDLKSKDKEIEELKDRSTWVKKSMALRETIADLQTQLSKSKGKYSEDEECILYEKFLQHYIDHQSIYKKWKVKTIAETWIGIRKELRSMIK